MKALTSYKAYEPDNAPDFNGYFIEPKNGYQMELHTDGNSFSIAHVDAGVYDLQRIVVNHKHNTLTFVDIYDDVIILCAAMQGTRIFDEDVKFIVVNNS